MALTRRQALQTLTGGGIAVGVAATAETSEASVAPLDADDTLGMLYDADRCIGCKACVTACASANGLEPDTSGSEGLYQMPERLNAQTMNIIQLCQDESLGHESYVKRQCMHCLEPACVSGCPFGALTKGDNSIVYWKADQCIGCRFCEVACPFEVPQFEWQSFNPAIVKCELCMHRVDEGIEPACCEVCPTDAVIFGKRGELLADAKNRIEDRPGHYFEDRVYGEHEAGGTQVLYLSRVPFTALGLPKLTYGSLPAYSNKYQQWLYKLMVLPIVLYGVILTFVRRNWRHHRAQAEEVEKDTGMMEQL